MRREARIREKILDYLQHHNVATVATCDGMAVTAAAVFYVNDGCTLYFLSSPDSRHGRNIAINPAVALTIQEDYCDWLEIKGVQMEGVASEISGAELERAKELYGEKFPVAGKAANAPAVIVKALAKVRWYRVVPSRLFFIDNSMGLGRREELVLQQPQ